MKSLAITLLAACLTLVIADKPKILKKWNGGCKVRLCTDVYKHRNGWTVHLSFSKSVREVQVWSGNKVSKVTDRHFKVYNPTSTLNPNSKHCFEGVIKYGGSNPPKITTYLEGNRSSKNYAEAMRLSILFYAAQRSGRLPSNNPIPWRMDSAMDDCVVGGWYDAGDHVKFGLPMAMSTTMLTLSLLKFRAGYERAGQVNEMYDTIKTPLDFFLKAWNPRAQSLVVQVGDGDIDHRSSGWVQAEGMKMDRPCLKANRNNPGSDIAAQTAAATAAGSIAFQQRDSGYSWRLREAAKSLYKFAKDNRGIFSDPRATKFYKSTSDKDDLCVAAMFLYKATRDKEYLRDAQNKFGTSNPSWALSWDDVTLTCQVLLYEETNDQKYKRAIDSYLKSWSRAGGQKYTPCGLAWKLEWGSNRYAANSAYAALLAADLGIDTYNNRKWAIEQINYILGDNRILKKGESHKKCLSFLVGFGNRYPQQPHHRGASCPAWPQHCDQSWAEKTSPNPQVLKGAMVGGPESDDTYNDNRHNYKANEVATDYNAGFQGALAGILELEGSAYFPWSHNPCACYEWY